MLCILGSFNIGKEEDKFYLLFEFYSYRQPDIKSKFSKLFLLVVLKQLTF